jgi:hypothetical protein
MMQPRQQQKIINEDEIPHRAARRPEVFDTVGKPLPTSLILGVPARTVMSLMGWSSSEMAARYQHVTDTIRQDVARQVDALIWQVRGAADTATADAPAYSDAAAGEAVVPVGRRSLATILSLAELGLAHADQATIASARAAVEKIRALLAEGADEPSSDSTRTTEGEEN